MARRRVRAKKKLRRRKSRRYIGSALHKYNLARKRASKGGKKRRKKVSKRRARAPKRRRVAVRIARRIKRLRARRGTVKVVSKPFLIRHRSVSTPGKVTDRLAVVVKVGRRNIAFYQSTGTGGGSKKGDWVPFNGISRQGGGWFIKLPGKVPTGVLKDAALSLEGRVGAPARVFDDGGRSMSEHNAAVNSYLERHGALQHDVDREEAGPFAIKTVNFRR